MTIEPDGSCLKKQLSEQLQSDIELGVKSPNYYDIAVQTQDEKDNMIRKYKNMMPGIRESK